MVIVGDFMCVSKSGVGGFRKVFLFRVHNYRERNNGGC